MKIAEIREMIERGMTDDEIEDTLHEAAVSDRDDHDRYGDEHEDERSTREKEMCDRLDMGRNDVGEWLGFM